MKQFVVVLALTLAGPTPANTAGYKGIGDNGPITLMDRTQTQLVQRVADFNRLGINWLRLDFDWSQIERRRGEYDFYGYDRVVTALNGGGIKILGIIAYSPPWANGEKLSKYYPPENVTDYARFASPRWRPVMRRWACTPGKFGTSKTSGNFGNQPQNPQLTPPCSRPLTRRSMAQIRKRSLSPAAWPSRAILQHQSALWNFCNPCILMALSPILMLSAIILTVLLTCLVTQPPQQLEQDRPAH